MSGDKPPLRLTMPAAPSMVRVASAFGEQAALAMGLAKPEALKLGLAAEEVFAYLARHTPDTDKAVLEAIDMGYGVELGMSLPPGSMPSQVFNLTATPSLEDEAGLDQLGLLIAAREVEHFYMDVAGESGLHLAFRKEKAYPRPEAAPPEPVDLSAFSVDDADQHQAKLLALMVPAHYPVLLYPPFTASPGKMADMVASGELAMALAQDELGNIGGCMMLKALSPLTMEAFGPYIFDQSLAHDMATALTEHCLNRLARTQYLGVVVRCPTEHLPREHFERLGVLMHPQPEGGAEEVPLYYRQLCEDPGARIWCHPRLEPFLKAEYQRLSLPRHLVATVPGGESRPEHSVLGVSINRVSSMCLLRPLVDGRDVGENLRRHLRHLGHEGIADAVFLLDLGQPWAPNLVPDLFEVGFVPRLVMPQGGLSDEVLLQLEAGQTR